MDHPIAYDLIRKLPKVDLHVHLDGSVKPETLMELAQQRGVSLPARSRKQLLPHMQVEDDCTSLKMYLSKFDFVLPFLQTGEALRRVAHETVEQAAAHTIGYIEVRFAPQLHRGAGLSVEEVIHHVVEGLRSGERKYGVVARGIAICMRHHGSKENIEVIEAAASRSGKGIVAVDLAGDEASYPPQFFREVFAVSHKRGLPVTIHAGEAAGAENVLEAVTRLGAVRIGHGVRVKENPELMRLLAKQRIPLEMCPISNLQTKAVTSWEQYPIRDYFERGIKVTVNTDNPTVSGTNLTKEYRVLADKFGFAATELAELVMNGVEAAFLEESEKRVLRRRFRRQFRELGVG
ncbi:adenosine deaminase [Paenibacillus cremeus]|uniref:Adenosine deaminase n=1 Tax=Paenibacillus cremeus TaxID=2163881 RepID=A0A559JMC2_9BACL|nr:adenosine deaminase [Paenibacillus cremeus]TVY01019.1 adenosine deaminase [Paenibacillus cremeus]